MALTEIIINGSPYLVTQEFGKSIQSMVYEAAKLSEAAYPDDSRPYPLYLTSVGRRVIAVIKEHRSATGMNLKDSKAVIDRVRGEYGGRELIGHYSFNDGARIVRAFREAGASVEFPSALELLAREGE